VYWFFSSTEVTEFETQNFEDVALYNPGDALYEERVVSVYIAVSGFGGLVVSRLASGTQDRGFEPGRSLRIFRAQKSTACLPSEGK
jgi:hypothetical protein